MHTYNPAERAASNPLGGYRARLGTTQTIAVATAADVSGLGFPVLAGEVWKVEFDLYIVGNTNGLAFSLTGPANPNAVLMQVVGNTTGITAISTEREIAFATPTSVAFAAAAVENFVRITATVAIGATAGTVQLQCSTVSGTNSSTILAGSTMLATRIS